MIRTRAEGSERIVGERDNKKREAYDAKGTRWLCQWEFTIPSPLQFKALFLQGFFSLSSAKTLKNTLFQITFKNL